MKYIDRRKTFDKVNLAQKFYEGGSRKNNGIGHWGMRRSQEVAWVLNTHRVVRKEKVLKRTSFSLCSA